MSWPENPNDPQQAQKPQQPPQPPPPPSQGFGPAPAWTPTGEMPQIHPPGPQGAPPQAPQPPQAQPPYGRQPGPAQPPQGPPAPPPAGFPPHAAVSPEGPGTPFGQPQPGQPSFAPGPQQPGPVRSRKTLYAVVGAVVALAVIGGGVAFAMKGGGKKSTEAKASPSASAPAQTAPSPTQDGPNSAGNGADSKPMVAGWQTQSWEKHGFVYDVPPKSAQWTVDTPDNLNSYVDQNGQPIVAMTGVSYYRQGGCASAGSTTGPIAAGKGQLATIGSQGSKSGTLQDNARNAAGNWGFAAYGGDGTHKPKVSVSQATPWKHNGINGYTATATVTKIYQPSSCVPATATARAIAMPAKDGTIDLWVIYADQGVPNALSSADIDKIMNTVRPYGTS